MKNINYTKTKTNYSIDKGVLIEFNDLTKKCAINKSALLQQFMIDWIKNNKK
jgi:hypothetical protein